MLYKIDQIIIFPPAEYVILKIHLNIRHSILFTRTRFYFTRFIRSYMLLFTCSQLYVKIIQLKIKSLELNQIKLKNQTGMFRNCKKFEKKTFKRIVENRQFFVTINKRNF